ncbi:MAG: type I 3-dehydroquinate dehydratase [Candidatus Anammoxibacter sp.]
MICIPITADSNQGAIKELKKASKFADIVELRIDYIDTPDLDALLKERSKPVIVTNRPKRQGGMFSGDETARIDLLKKAIALKADYIDIEHDSVGSIEDVGDTKLIVSYHDFNATPSNINQIHSDLTKSGADIAKLVTFANDITDNFRIFDMLNETDFPTIAFCMGELGHISRVLSSKFGGKLVFASLDKGKESAPGQLTIDEIRNVYRVQEINRETEIFGLLGNPVAHSMGPYIHNAALKENGINAVYVLFKVDKVSGFIDHIKKIGVKGLSVTIPHKEAVMEFLDEIDPIAKEIGAVNTIVNRTGKLSGCNTDCPAAISALEEVLVKTEDRIKKAEAKENPNPQPPIRNPQSTIRNKKVVVIGAGGAARAIAFGLKEKGADITIINRTYERALALSNDVGCNCAKFDELEKLKIDILINTTSVGMFPHVDESLAPDTILKNGMVVFDIIYNPTETKLLQEAKSKGCTVLNGVDMFVKQAALQFELFTGQKAPDKLMKNIINEFIG